jgi:hypothetical protein
LSFGVPGWVLTELPRNAGHEFNGRSSGFGALSIWTHHLKSFEYMPEYTDGSYTGRAARAGAGIETWEIKNYMNKYNMTMEFAGGETVGVYGGWIAGGGHNLLSSLYGHGADQILAFQVVTPDGRFHTVTPKKNKDLFFAMLGGGGGESGARSETAKKTLTQGRQLRCVDLGHRQGPSTDSGDDLQAGVPSTPGVRPLDTQHAHSPRRGNLLGRRLALPVRRPDHL